MPKDAEKRANKYYFADVSVGSNEYHGLDLSKPLTSLNLVQKGTDTPTCTLVTSEGEIDSDSWVVETHGVTKTDTINFDLVTNTLSIKLAAHSVGRYNFKFYIVAQYTDDSLREDLLVYNVYMDIYK